MRRHGRTCARKITRCKQQPEDFSAFLSPNIFIGTERSIKLRFGSVPHRHNSCGFPRATNLERPPECVMCHAFGQKYGLDPVNETALLLNSTSGVAFEMPWKYLSQAPHACCPIAIRAGMDENVKLIIVLSFLAFLLYFASNSFACCRICRTL